MKHSLTTLAILTAFGTASAEPNNRADRPVPVVEAVIPQAADWAEVDVVGYPDFKCSLFTSTDLREWTLLASGDLGETGAATFVDRQTSPAAVRYYRCCYDDDPRIINLESVSDYTVFEISDEENQANVPEKPSPPVYAWIQDIEMPDIPLDEPVNVDLWKTLVEEVPGNDQLPPLPRTALDLAAHKKVALCIRIRTLQLELRTLAARIKECQIASDHEGQAACAQLIRTFQAKQRLLEEAKAAKQVATAELSQAKAEAARILADPSSKHAPSIGELKPEERKALDAAKAALWKACERLRAIEDGLASGPQDAADCAKELADLQARLDAVSKAAKDAAALATQAQETADEAAEALRTLKKEVALADTMESQWGARILSLGDEIFKLRHKRQKTAREVERLARSKVLHRQAQAEQAKWFIKVQRLRKLVPKAEAKVARLQTAADQAKAAAKQAQDATESARTALANAKARWATASKSQQDKQTAKQTAEAAKNQAAKALDQAIRKAEQQAEANRQQREKEEQERLDKEKADADAAEAAAAKEAAELEEKVACCLALMHQLGVQSGKAGKFPEPGTPGFGLAVKAVTKYVASSVGGKGVSPVIPLGTFGVLKELYTTIRAFFDPRSGPGMLRIVLKLQQMQKKNGERYSSTEAWDEVEKMAELMNHWEALLK